MSDVRFVAVSPASLIRKTYAAVDVVMHEPGYEQTVEQVAAEHDEPTRTTDGGWLAAARGTQVRVELSSPELGNLGSEQGIWQGRYLRFGFVFPVPADAPDQVALCATVLFNEVPATRLRVILTCESGVHRQPPLQRVEPERHDVTSAFMSYASQDRQRVATIIQGMRVARPDLSIFFDVENLRSGQHWQQELQSEIERCDVLYLCWSRHAMESQWVDFEWRYAYQTKGVDVIEPVAIDPPDVCPPPIELNDKHFNDFLLYVINAPKY